MKKRLRRWFGRRLCSVGLHDWKPWEHGNAFRYRECRRRGCEANQLGGSQW